jgi:hypothetical protein
MMENRERMSSVERMDATAGHQARRADELKTIAQAAKPLYGSFDDTQKRKFELLGHEMMMEELEGDGSEGSYRGLPACCPTCAARDSGGEWAEGDAGAPGRQDIGWNSDEAQARLHALAFAAA